MRTLYVRKTQTVNSKHGILDVSGVFVVIIPKIPVATASIRCSVW